MAKKRRGPQPPKGRAKPIGPVLGLARAEEGIGDPIRKQLIKEEVWPGVDKVVSSREWLDNFKFRSRLLAVTGGNIQLGSVNPDLTLSPAQRKPATHDPLGDIRFDDPRQIFSEEDWEGLGEPGSLLVMRGFLGRTAVPGAGPSFNFEPVAWDVTEPDRHMTGKLVLPPAEAL